MTPDELSKERAAQEHLEQRRRDIERERGQSGGFERIGDILDGIIPTRPAPKAVQKGRPPYPEKEKKIPKNSGKLPAFPLYAKDWLSDLELQSCSFAAKGLFIDMLCRMHISRRPGYLLLPNSSPVDDPPTDPPIDRANKALLRVLSINHQTFHKLSQELLNAGVLKQDDDGIFYCVRMVKDAKLREKDRERHRQKRERNE